MEKKLRAEIEFLEYQAHVQSIGWQGKKHGGKIAGTTGESLRIEAIEIKVE